MWGRLPPDNRAKIDIVREKLGQASRDAVFDAARARFVRPSPPRRLQRRRVDRRAGQSATGRYLDPIAKLNPRGPGPLTAALEDSRSTPSAQSRPAQNRRRRGRTPTIASQDSCAAAKEFAKDFSGRRHSGDRHRQCPPHDRPRMACIAEATGGHFYDIADFERSRCGARRGDEARHTFIRTRLPTPVLPPRSRPRRPSEGASLRASAALANGGTLLESSPHVAHLQSGRDDCSRRKPRPRHLGQSFPAGNYDIEAEVGAIKARQTVVIHDGEAKASSCPLDAAHLVARAVASKGGAPSPDRFHDPDVRQRRRFRHRRERQARPLSCPGRLQRDGRRRRGTSIASRSVSRPARTSLSMSSFAPAASTFRRPTPTARPSKTCSTPSETTTPKVPTAGARWPDRAHHSRLHTARRHLLRQRASGSGSATNASPSVPADGQGNADARAVPSISRPHRRRAGKGRAEHALPRRPHRWRPGSRRASIGPELALDLSPGPLQDQRFACVSHLIRLERVRYCCRQAGKRRDRHRIGPRSNFAPPIADCSGHRRRLLGSRRSERHGDLAGDRHRGDGDPGARAIHSALRRPRQSWTGRNSKSGRARAKRSRSDQDDETSRERRSVRGCAVSRVELPRRRRCVALDCCHALSRRIVRGKSQFPTGPVPGALGAEPRASERQHDHPRTRRQNRRRTGVKLVALLTGDGQQIEPGLIWRVFRTTGWRCRQIQACGGIARGESARQAAARRIHRQRGVRPGEPDP